jgi:hypothetical protein
MRTFVSPETGSYQFLCYSFLVLHMCGMFQVCTCLELAALKEAENCLRGQYLSILLVNNIKLKYIYLNYAKHIFHYTASTF